MVLRFGNISDTTYGESLIQVLDMQLSSPAHIQLYSGMSNQKLKPRLKKIMEGTKMKSRNSIFSMLVILAVAVFVLPLANMGNAKNSTEQNKIMSSEKEFTAPLKSGKLKDLFGYRHHSKKKRLIHHQGIDISAKKGTEIFAVKSGTVVKVKENYKINKGYGKYILINHGSGFKTVYGHMSKILVSEGDKVKVGQAIALVGSTGLATGPHLHYEVRKDDKPVDPALYTDFSNLGE